MAKQTINLGTMADNKSGDPLRTAFTKVNQNFDELYAQTNGGVGVNVGDQTTEPSQVTDIVFSGATVENVDGVSTVSIPTDISQFTDTDNLLHGGNTGNLSLHENTITGQVLNQVGYQLTINTDYNGDQPAINGNGLNIPANTPNVNQIAVGWNITLANGHREVVAATYNYPPGGYWVIGWDESYSSNSVPIYPVTITSPDYMAGDPATVTLEAGANQVTLDENGHVVLPNTGTITSHSNNLVGSNFAQLQWIESAGLDLPDPNTVNGLRSNWAYVDEGGYHVETGVNTPYSKAWNKTPQGEFVYPDGTKQITAYEDGNRAWFGVAGDGFNSIPSWADERTGNYWYDVVCALPDNTVIAGGAWGWGDRPILAQYDKTGKVLWQWMAPIDDYNGDVSSIAFDPNSDRLRVSITASVGRNYWGTRLVYFIKNPNPTNFADVWTVDSAAALYDANDDGDVYVVSSTFVNGNWVGVGQKSGTAISSATNVTPAVGSAPYKLLINKSDLTQINGRWPEQNGGWCVRSVHDGANMFNGQDVSWVIGRFINVPFTVTSGNGVGGRFDFSIDYNTNTYKIDASLWGDGYAVGDTITILGSNLNGVDGVNDINLVVVQSAGQLDVVDFVGTPVPQTDNILFNFELWGWYNDFSDTSIRLDFYISPGDDPFIYSDAHEFTKVHSRPDYGHYNHVVWNNSEQCYFAAGHSQSQLGNNGLLDKILPNGTVAWTKSGTGEITGLATDGDRVYVTAIESSSIVALDAATGDKIWETGETAQIPWGWGVENLVISNGYLYAAGRGGSMWSWNGIIVSQIDPLTGLANWTRFIHAEQRQININWNFNSQFLAVTEDSVYIACNGNFKSDNYNAAGLIRIPVDGGPELEATSNQDFDIDNQFRIDGKFNNVPLSAGRAPTTWIDIVNRTDLSFISTDISYDTNFTQQSYYPTFSTVLTSLTPQSGIEFGDGTPRAKHNPVDVAQVDHNWNVNNTYTLQLSDRGKFIRTQWAWPNPVYVRVPTDSQVNFPVGTVITLINMWDYNANSIPMYISALNDDLGQRAHVYLAGQGPFPQNGGWSPQFSFQGRGTATLMKVGSNEWLLTGNNITDSDY